MEYETPVKRPRTTRESYAANQQHLYYSNSILVDERTTLHIRQILSSLQQAVTSQQRLATLHQLLSIVGYDPSTRRCRCDTGILLRLLEGKCVHVLCLQLGYVLSRRSFADGEHNRSTTDPSQEVTLISIALDAFYRHCPELTMEDSIRTSGSEVLRLSREVLGRLSLEMVGRNGNRRKPSEIVADLRPNISIWHSLSSCNLGTTLLLQDPQTLQIVNTILCTLKQQQQQHSHENSFGGIEVIMECLGLLKNLSYYGEDCRHLIIHQDNLISTLTSLTDVPSDKAQERLSAVFRNLALSVDVRSLLTRRANVLTAIVRMSSLCILPSNNTKTKTDTERSICQKNTLRSILSAVTSLAIDTSTTHLMVFHGDGVLIEQLKQFAMYEDSVARKRAVRALRLLARDPSSAPVMVLQNNQLLEILSDRALNDPNDSVRAEATEAFCKCANLIRAPMAQHEYILESLTRMLVIATTRPPMTTANLDVVARAVQEQASDPVNRKGMTRQRDLLEALATVIRSETTSLGGKESVCAALVDLSEEPLEEAIALPILLDALVQTLLPPPGGGAPPRTNTTSQDAIGTAHSNIDAIVRNRIRESSVQTLLNLAKTPSNRKAMAQQTALIQSLLRFAAATTTREEVKKQVKAVILQLATDL